MRILFFLCFVATTYGQKLDELYIIRMELLQLLKETKGLYLVHKDYKQDGFYIAKKITLEPKFKLSVSSEEVATDFVIV